MSRRVLPCSSIILLSSCMYAEQRTQPHDASGHETRVDGTGRNARMSSSKQNRLPRQLSRRGGTQSADGQESHRHLRSSLDPSRSSVRYDRDNLSPGTSLTGSLGSSIIGGEHSTSSTTSNKTMKSLSASVYDELQPFRLAHRNLIKVSQRATYSSLL